MRLRNESGTIIALRIRPTVTECRSTRTVRDADRNSDAVASDGNPTSVWEGNAALYSTDTQASVRLSNLPVDRCSSGMNQGTMDSVVLGPLLYSQNQLYHKYIQFLRLAHTCTVLRQDQSC